MASAHTGTQKSHVGFSHHEGTKSQASGPITAFCHIAKGPCLIRSNRDPKENPADVIPLWNSCLGAGTARRPWNPALLTKARRVLGPGLSSSAAGRAVEGVTVASSVTAAIVPRPDFCCCFILRERRHKAPLPPHGVSAWATAPQQPSPRGHFTPTGSYTQKNANADLWSTLLLLFFLPL